MPASLESRVGETQPARCALPAWSLGPDLRRVAAAIAAGMLLGWLANALRR